MAGYSPKLPLTYDSVDGFYKLTKTIKEMAAQNFKMLVLTSPGERVMDPDFGVGLRKYLFENRDEGLEEDIELRIQKQAQKYLPYIEILDIAVTGFDDAIVPSPEDFNTLGVSISYRITSINVIDTLNIA
jgi:hypothetical protein